MFSIGVVTVYGNWWFFCLCSDEEKVVVLSSPEVVEVPPPPPWRHCKIGKQHPARESVVIYIMEVKSYCIWQCAKITCFLFHLNAFEKKWQNF